MKQLLSLTAILFGIVSACTAQNQTQTISIQNDSVPTSTIVPVIQKAADVRDTITESAAPQKPMTRTERRARRAHDYSFMIDSLIASRAYAFYPTFMQAVPDGEITQIYANYFYIYVSPVDLEVHLPVEQCITQQTSLLNFDTESIANYTAVKYLAQWNISFTAMHNGIEYGFALDVSTITGRTELTVECPKGMMQYVGSIGKRVRERR